MISSMRVGLELPAGIGHAAGFHLEHGDVLAALHQLEGRPVIERDMLEIELRHPLGERRLTASWMTRERLQAEEVHLEHAHFRERAHGVLRDDFLLRCRG